VSVVDIVYTCIYISVCVCVCFKAPPVPGRDPDRWRLDAFGNPVCKRLTSCEGCLCHEYDHIVPYSQGGASTVDNCQILQTRINRLKADRQLTAEQLKSFACEIRFSERELDLIEMAVYGNVQRDNFRCRCKSFFEVFRETTIPTGTNNR